MCEATFQRCDDNALADSSMRDREDRRHRNASAPRPRRRETDRGRGPPSARVAAAEARARVRARLRDDSAGETVAVAASGGKDSNALIYLLREMSARRLLGKDTFDLRAVHLDQKQPGHDPKPLADWVRGLGIPFDLVEEDTYSIVVEKTAPTKSYCGLCSRLRRGILYTHTQQIGARIDWPWATTATTRSRRCY